MAGASQMVSIARTRQRYSEGQRVTATVEKVLPFGVFVRLADGTRAYIRRRELSLEGDRPPGEIVSEGQTLQAVVLSPAEAGRLMELTVRAIHPDPWEQFVRRYKVRDTVTATVKHVVPNGVFVQIIPGVNGFIPLEELVSWRVEKAEDVVWTGDEVEAVITRIDPSRKKVNLSIRQRMEQLARVESVFRQIGFTEGVPDSIAAELIGESASSQEEAAEFVGRIGPILVLDDHDSIRDPLVQWLIRQGYTACGAKTVPEALTLCQAQPYGLILVDLDLPQIDGLQFIRQIRDCGERTFIAVMSSPEWIDEHFLEIQQLGVSEMFPKPVNEQKLRQFLLRLDRGEIIEPRIDLRESSLPEIRTAQQLSAVMRSRIPLARRFHNGLEYLLEMTRAEEAIVFHMDRTSRIVSIVASVGRGIL
jgi:Ribosomal protein S1